MKSFELFDSYRTTKYMSPQKFRWSRWNRKKNDLFPTGSMWACQNP